MKEWADAYHERFGIEPDGLALGQYDGEMMTLQMIKDGAKTAEDLVAALGSSTYEGVAMTYKSDGEGDMAHDDDIVRSEERREGKEGVSTCRSRWSPCH